MRANSVARRYARAIFDVAQEKGDPRLWLDQLEALAAVVSDPDLSESLRSPSVPERAKTEALLKAFPDFPEELRNVVRLLVARNRVDILPGICVAMAQYLDELLGRVDATVVSARPLGVDEVKAVQVNLSKRTGRTVKISAAVDDSLIGGIVMRVGDEVIDGSVATRLERLRQRLT